MTSVNNARRTWLGQETVIAHLHDASAFHAFLSVYRVAGTFNARSRLRPNWWRVEELHPPSLRATAGQAYNLPVLSGAPLVLGQRGEIGTPGGNLTLLRSQRRRGKPATWRFEAARPFECRMKIAEGRIPSQPQSALCTIYSPLDKWSQRRDSHPRGADRPAVCETAAACQRLSLLSRAGMKMVCQAVAWQVAKAGGSPRCCLVLCGLRDRCIAAMLATQPRHEGGSRPAGRRSQACGVLADTGFRVT